MVESIHLGIMGHLGPCLTRLVSNQQNYMPPTKCFRLYLITTYYPKPDQVINSFTTIQRWNRNTAVNTKCRRLKYYYIEIKTAIHVSRA